MVCTPYVMCTVQTERNDDTIPSQPFAIDSPNARDVADDEKTAWDSEKLTSLLPSCEE